MHLNIKEIIAKADEDFEKAWRETGGLVGGRGAFKMDSKGTTHVLMDTANLLRGIYLDLGFSEVVNPMIVDEADIYKQYGHEAPAILDRCYYLATLPRPDIGISADRVELIRQLGGPTDGESLSRLSSTFHDYKKGRIDGDDLVEKLTEALAIDDVTALKILDVAFPELRRLEPKPTRLLLRSHMTSAWFVTCEAVQHRLQMPVKLFSVGLRARREQQEDNTHLRFHHAASSVLMDPEVSVDDGRAICQEVLSRIGFTDVRVEKKKVTAKYYAPETEHEVFAKVEGSGGNWVEVMDFGLYGPIALARYGIEYPVLNIGMGVERIAALLHGFTDIRELSYPQFHGEWVLSDADLARQISFLEEPKTPAGSEVERAIVRALEANRDAPSPCEFIAYQGLVGGREATVKVHEPDPNVKLVGPAAFNEITVLNGNVIGIPEKGMEKAEMVLQARRDGIRTGLRFVDTVAKAAAARIETDGKMELRVRMAKLPSDINVKISEVGVRYISSKHGKVDVRGPVFIGVTSDSN
jgi:O-phosphoseryl-tRNA synthetase